MTPDLVAKHGNPNLLRALRGAADLETMREMRHVDSANKLVDGAHEHVL